MSGTSHFTFGQMLRQLRESRGISLTDFAKRIGQKPSNLSNIEHGSRKPWRDGGIYMLISNQLGLDCNEMDAMMLLVPSYVEFKKFEQMREEIRSSGGSGWDQIEDPDKFLKDLRGDGSSDWEEESFVDRYDPENDCPRCQGSGQVTTESYESYFGDNFKTCPLCGGNG